MIKIELNIPERIFLSTQLSSQYMPVGYYADLKRAINIAEKIEISREEKEKYGIVHYSHNALYSEKLVVLKE